MTGPLLTGHRKMLAYEAAEALADRYEALAADLLARAEFLRHASLDDLRSVPVKHMHSGARLREDRLDEALMAL